MSTIDLRFASFEGFSPVSTLGPYRAVDYWTLPDGVPVELMRGELVMSPAPRASHQIIVGRLFLILSRAEQVGGGLTIMSPADVVLSDNTILQPDLFYLAKQRRGLVGDRINGAPDLVVEVLSPGSERRDRVQKLDLYAQYGIPEFWIVDPTTQYIEFLLLENGRYVVTQSTADRYQSPRLPEVEIDLAAFWRDVADRMPQES